MCYEFMKESTQTARKDYFCDGCNRILESGHLSIGMNFAQYRVFARAKRLNFWIKKGERYRKIISRYEGRLVAFRVRVDIDDICEKLDVYIDD